MLFRWKYSIYGNALSRDSVVSENKKNWLPLESLAGRSSSIDTFVQRIDPFHLWPLPDAFTWLIRRLVIASYGSFGFCSFHVHGQLDCPVPPTIGCVLLLFQLFILRAKSGRCTFFRELVNPALPRWVLRLYTASNYVDGKITFSPLLGIERTHLACLIRRIRIDFFFHWKYSASLLVRFKFIISPYGR